MEADKNKTSKWKGVASDSEVIVMFIYTILLLIYIVLLVFISFFKCSVQSLDL